MSAHTISQPIVLALVLLALLAAFSFSPAPARADGLVVIEDCFSGPVTPPQIQPPFTSPCFWPFFCPTPVPVRPRPVPHPDCGAYLAVKNHDVTVTVKDQVARTHVDQTFVNPSDYQLEGTYIFPLPEDATINDFAMYVDGKRLEGKVLDRNQARQIYEDIVRQRRDPALLEYVGHNAFQARIFPIEPHSEKRVEIGYGQVLNVDSGLVKYVYPLSTEKFSSQPLASVSINVSVESGQALKAIYSPSHPVSVTRSGDYSARIGFEASNVTPNKDFVLYYSVSSGDIGATLLSCRPDSKTDGFFLLLVTPHLDVAASQVVSKDVFLVLDTSGSMQGQKVEQAKNALKYVLEHLNQGDRFNIVTFSTGTTAYARGLQPASAAADAERFVARIQAEGSTDINRALLEALREADAERPTIVVFLTDGLPTVGEMNVQKILANVDSQARKNLRMFTFGVGDDVNTFLLDSLSEKHRGASAYVRPGEQIDETVSEFYRKVSTPVLSDLSIDFGDTRVADVYPYPVPDLFAGSQLVIAGRYVNGGGTTLTVKGQVNGQSQSYTFSGVSFKSVGGDDFIAPLWATRKIGYLLAQIRLHGENKEAVDEIVSLAVRYGIVTPYTSFLIDESQDVLTREGRVGAAKDLNSQMAPAITAPLGMGGPAPTAVAGPTAVAASQANRALKEADTAASNSSEVKQVGDKAFILREGVWTDTTFDPSRMNTSKIAFGSAAYFDLMTKHPEWAAYLSLGERVIFLAGGTAYEVTRS